jgi:uncharacterized repeat protein (TIGR03806 family)
MQLRLSPLILLLAIPSLAADDPPAELPFECRFTDGPITIDGKAEEAAWKHAQVIDKFTLPWLQEPRAARTATRARLLWDRENLYFFADMDDGDLFADVTEHDGKTWDNDVFELFFKPAEDKQGYYEFQVNVANTQFDMFMPQRGQGDFEKHKKDGDFRVQSAVQFRGTLNKRQDEDKGWSVEGQIPWKSLVRTGGRPAVDEIWKFTLCRYDYSVAFDGPELSNCLTKSSVPKADFHHWEDYAQLKFVGPKKELSVKPWGVLNYQPLTTSRVAGSPEPPLPYRTMKAFPKLPMSFPITLMRQPGSDLFLVIVQDRPYSTTRICRFKDSPEATELEHILDQPKDGTAYGIAFHPKFAENGYVYIGWNGPLEDKPEDKDGKKPKATRVTRYTMDRQPPYKLEPGSAVEIISWESNGHNGGDVAFGLDGMFLVTSGDGTSDSDTNVTGQDLTKPLAKLLRIDVDHPADGKQYSIPKDNPFLGQKDIVHETYAYGFRNPWKLTVDPKTGHIWVGNNGQDLWEQVYFVRPGDNFGWSVFEGSHDFYLTRQLGPNKHTPPAAEHPHSESRSLTGGVVYHGSKLPELQGAYIYGDHSTGRVWGIKHDGNKVIWHKLLVDTPFNVSGFAIDTHGELLVADHHGEGKGGYYYLEPTPPVLETTAPFPKTLSASGLFTSVKGHQMQPGAVPYSVNSSLWSDGAYKERYIAIPHKEGHDMRIGFSTGRGWFFPDETVLIKSFALEEPGNAETRKWIETRFLVKQQGEWAGYSYLWNDEQTEGTLVPGEGLDRTFKVGSKQQAWHYPSRTECMVCHSRAANYVLGLTEAQMNKDHDYGGGVIDNQLRTLECLGMLKVNYEAAGKPAHMQRTAVADSTLLSKNPDQYKKLADPYDDKAPLETRVRSYLQSNCAHCHVDAGGGNAQFNAEHTASLSDTKLIDVAPVHDKFDLPDAKLVAPGHPERSVLLYRLSHRGRGQMPQLATNLVDEKMVKVVEEWIRQLPSSKEP